MPLSARARVELYLPERNEQIYKDLLEAVVSEFTEVFGGCTVAKADGSYQYDDGRTVTEKVLVVYTDTDLDFQENVGALDEYAEKLRLDVFKALDEEEILIVTWPVFHSV